MIRNYLTVALRHLLKNKTFSAINILGLSTGIACCLLLSLYIEDEFSYEKHFDGHERVFRMYTTFTRDGIAESFPRTSPPIAMDLINDFGEVETATRVVNPPEVDVHLIRYGENIYHEKKGVLVDSSFLKVFPYSLKEGDPATALNGPSSIVLSEKLSTKIFRDKSPLDELLIVNSGRTADTFRITGVIMETPYHSHVDADFYMSMHSDGWGAWIRQEDTWAWNNFVGSYLKLRTKESAAAIEAKLPALLEKRAGAELKQSGLGKELHLQPLDDVRLYSDFSDSFGDTGSGGITYVYILGSLGVFILLLACINFMNLTTAKASQRAGEVGIRKSMGAYRSNLILQFVGESMTIVAISLILAMALCLGVLPLINDITAKELSINNSNIIFLVGSLVSIGLITGLVAGSYPAFFLSSFEPVRVLKNKSLSGDGSQWLRKGMVVFQFVVTITLIASILIIQKQLNYINNKPLGFRTEEVIMIPLRNEEASNQFVNLRSRLKELSGVKEVSGTTSLPSTPLFRDFALYPQGSTSDMGQLHRVVHADEDYFKLLDIKLLAGRDFVAEKDTFSYETNDNRIIVNRKSLETFGIPLDQSIGSLLFAEWDGVLRKHEIIGVVEDFHQLSLHQPIVPMLFVIPRGRSEYSYLAASIETSDLAGIKEQLQAVWKDLVKSAPFEMQFLRESVEKQYESESRISLMLTWSAGLAIVICCLGLYGLSVYVAERRIKEIGIRKVLGASVTGIVRMLSLEFIILVLIAFVVATPLGYYAMNKWLQGFAYKIEPGFLTFLLAGLLAFLIAWLTVGFESVKAASGNPIKALRNE